jgi:ubiquitin-protein ligase
VVAAALDQGEEEGEKFIENALALPLAEQYRALLGGLRFDYMDMRDPNINTSGSSSGTSDYVHHYKAMAAQNESPPPAKMIRLAQELADLSNALPCEHTNSIYVRVDRGRVDMMKALIVGSSNTPYAHGCFEFDIFCDNKYPNDSLKMNLMTTGAGSVRFNPNLYACGKVCLSLLGTWRGNATENWDPKLSTILQVLVSVQAIIMAEEVYFNEPGFENEAGTVEGEKKNEGYSNIVRYSNVKFAMLGQLKNPPRGFESVIKRHFYVKKAEILKEVHHWLELASKHEAAYTGLIHDHNYKWCTEFKQSKTRYKEMLTEVVKALEDELNKLDKPTDISNMRAGAAQGKKRTTQRQQKLASIAEGQVELEDIDVADDQIDSGKKAEDMDVEDEKVMDRWSRYIGAMGVEAVAKQAAASIFLSGAGALGVEIAKNIVLSGCKSFTLHDPKPVCLKDLSG